MFDENNDIFFVSVGLKIFRHFGAQQTYFLGLKNFRNGTCSFSKMKYRSFSKINYLSNFQNRSFLRTNISLCDMIFSKIQTHSLEAYFIIYFFNGISHSKSKSRGCANNH